METVRTGYSGTLQYEIFFNEDKSEAVVFERYRTEADLAARMARWAGPLVSLVYAGSMSGVASSSMTRFSIQNS
jgi:hypothetical protein